MLNEHTVQFEWEILVIGSLEGIIGASDECEKPIGVSARNIAGVVVPGGGDLVVAVVVAQVAGQQIHRSGIEPQADLAFAGRLPADGVDDLNRGTGRGRPIEPGLTGEPEVLPINAGVSVCPKPSRIVSPDRFWTCAMTSGFSGSPAPTASRNAAGLAPRSA
jgi:hypothetical protein